MSDDTDFVALIARKEARLTELKSTAASEPDVALTFLNRDAPVRTSAVLADTACDGCGYNLRSLELDARCPECNRAVADSLVGGGGSALVSRADRRWALAVCAGVFGLLFVCPGLMWIDLNMSFNEVAFGTAPALNVPGPKVWATPLVQRSIGSHVEWLGAEGTWLTLLSLLAIHALTTARRTVGPASPMQTLFRLATRWLPVLLVGGFFGFLLNAENTYSSGQDAVKYTMIGVAFVELPGTALLLAYLAHVANSLGKSALKTQFWLAMVGTAIAQLAAVGMAFIAPSYEAARGAFLVQLGCAVYEAFSIGVAIATVSAMVRLMLALATRVLPQRWRTWAA